MAVIEPVTLQEVKEQCRVDFDMDDDLLISYITAARQWAEGFLNICLIAQEGEGGNIEVKQTWRQAILLVVSYWYANRENASSPRLTEIPLGAKDLLWLDRNVPV